MQREKEGKNLLETGKKVIPLILPIVVMIILSSLDMINYYISDDFLLNFISMGGGTGVANEHLVFVNCVIGYILKAMYNVFSFLNWYGMLYIVAILLCVYSLYFLLNKYIGSIYALIIVILIELFMTFFLTFTIIAYMCTGIATIAYIEYISDSGHASSTDIGKVFIISLLFALGYMIRDDAFMTALILSVPLVIFNIKTVNKKKFIKLSLFVAILIFAIYGINKLEYSSDFWKEYSEYNVARSHMGDFPRAEYEDNREAYNRIDISENDIECIDRIIFADKEVFSKETLNGIFNINSFDEKYNLNILDILYGIIKTKEAWVLLISTVIFLICNLGSKRKYFILQSLLTYGMVAALFFRNRAVLRVIAPLCVLGILFMLYMHIKREDKDYNTSKKLRLYFVIIPLIGLVACYGIMALQVSSIYKNNSKKYDVVLDYLEQNKNNLYIATGYDRNPIVYNKSVLEIGYNQTNTNLISFGDWDIYNDIYYDIVEKYDLTYKDRLILDVVEDENVFCLTKLSDSSTIDTIKKYIEEHTARKVDIILEHKIEEADVAIYNIKYEEIVAE